MRDKVTSMGMTGIIELAGFVSDRELVLETLRQHDILLFCHKTPESPRCLIEALACGCAIVGYRSHYAEDLVSAYGGGAFSRINDVDGLTALVSKLHSDRPGLKTLITQAGRSGRQFSDVAVFRHRSDLIKSFL